MITDPNYNRIRIAVEKVIARHDLHHLADSIARAELPGAVKAATYAAGGALIVVRFRQRVDAICHTARSDRPGAAQSGRLLSIRGERETQRADNGKHSSSRTVG